MIKFHVDGRKSRTSRSSSAIGGEEVVADHLCPFPENEGIAGYDEFLAVVARFEVNDLERSISRTCRRQSDYLYLSPEEVTHDEFVGVCVPRIGVMAYRRRSPESPSVYVHLDGIETGRLDLPVHLTVEEAD